MDGLALSKEVLHVLVRELREYVQEVQGQVQELKEEIRQLKRKQTELRDKIDVVELWRNENARHQCLNPCKVKTLKADKPMVTILPLQGAD